MEELNFKKSPIEKAVSDFLSANQSRLKLLEYEPTTMSETLDEYDETVMDRVKSKKYYWADKLEANEIGSKKSIEVSNELYNDSINNLDLIEIPDVSSTRPYYQNGRIHHNVNERLFTWKFRKEDLD
jgi:hypothetical protein